MANERASGKEGLLAASIAEQLREKADQAKEAEQRKGTRTERRSARYRSWRARPRAERWLLIGLAVTALVRAFLARR